MAAHTCPDAYNVHVYTFPSLLFMCDELQEWGRKTWNELYTGLNEHSVQLKIETFMYNNVEIEETVNMENAEDVGHVLNNVCNAFERQYSIYKTTFRDGQDTAHRDFDLKKTIKFNLKSGGTDENTIVIRYNLPKDTASKFEIDLSKYLGKAEDFQEKVISRLSGALYEKSVDFIMPTGTI